MRVDAQSSHRIPLSHVLDIYEVAEHRFNAATRLLADTGRVRSGDSGSDMDSVSWTHRDRLLGSAARQEVLDGIALVNSATPKNSDADPEFLEAFNEHAHAGLKLIDSFLASKDLSARERGNLIRKSINETDFWVANMLFETVSNNR